MKKYSTSILLIAVGLIVTVGSQVFHRPTKLEAVDNVTKQIGGKEVAPMLYKDNEASKTADEKIVAVDYTLPYPGILPNHPLFFIKELRDKLIELLVVDPTRKAEFYLLQADKWLASGKQLADKNEMDQAKTIVQRSAARMLQVEEILKNEAKNGKPVLSGTLDKFEKAAQKHLEVVRELQLKSSDFTNSLETLQKVVTQSEGLR